MPTEKDKPTLRTPFPKLDKSKWTGKVTHAKPIEPRNVLEAARAIRANPELWAIFARLKPDDWISEEDGAKISRFSEEYFVALGRPGDGLLNGQEKVVLRALAEGRLKSLENDDEVIALLKKHRPSGI